MENKIKISTIKTILHILALFILLIVGNMISDILCGIFFDSSNQSQSMVHNILRNIIYFVFTFGAYMLYTKKILHISLKDFGITLDLKLWNIICSIILPLFVICIFMIIGSVSVTRNLSFGKKISIVIYALFDATVSGILEEMLFRGYIMKLLEFRWNKLVAIVVPSVLFALAHIPGMGSLDIIDVILLFVGVTLAGIMFSLVAYKSNSINGSAVMHTMWNCLMMIIHFATGKAMIGTAIISIDLPKDNVLITGGAFGIESSLPAIIGYSLVCIFVLYSMKKEKC